MRLRIDAGAVAPGFPVLAIVLVVLALGAVGLAATPRRAVAQAQPQAQMQAGPHAQGPSSLAGNWVLDSARSQLPERRGERRSGGRFSGGGYGGHPGGGFRGGMRGGRSGMSGAGGQDFQAMMMAMRTILARQPRLAIQPADSSVTLATPDGGPMQFSTDGQAHDLVMPGDVHASTTATWKNDQLVLDSQYQGGLEIEQTFEQDPDSSARLVASIQIKGLPRGGTRTFQTVYDRAPAAPAGGS